MGPLHRAQDHHIDLAMPEHPEGTCQEPRQEPKQEGVLTAGAGRRSLRRRSIVEGCMRVSEFLSIIRRRTSSEQAEILSRFRHAETEAARLAAQDQTFRSPSQAPQFLGSTQSRTGPK